MQVAVVSPAATVQDAFGNAAVVLLFSATGAPPSGAGPLNVTVTAALAPPTIEAGEIETDEVDGIGATNAVKLLPATAWKPGLSVIVLPA